ncbi:MAG: ferrochelatase [Acidimicrobiales bacterium]|nr:MAG: ferrochelatase [Acidimicrobiales bacterium]
MGVLVMAYGTPASPQEVASFYTDVRRGRPPPPDLLADLVRRYDAIGGISPLAERTRAQCQGLQGALDRAAEGRFRVFFGAKHARPFIEEAVTAMSAAGLERGVGLVLAPHFSALSVGQYIERARAASEGTELQLSFVESWHLAPGLIELLAERLTSALATLPDDLGGAEVLVTAHSLPSRILAMGDPYPEQLRATAEAVCERAGIDRWRLAWQSAGRTAEPWIGPDILEVIRGLPAEAARAVAVCPAGFTSDHLEVLYDIDIEARRVAEEVGLVLTRTASLNDDPRFLATLAQVVMAAASKAEP